jgi:hypothetical protein
MRREAAMRKLSRIILTAAACGAVGYAAADDPRTGPAAPAGGERARTESVLKAADPLGAMLAESKSAYGKIRDYTCIYTRQERVDGALGAEEVGELKVRANPYSVSVRFARPESAAGLAMTYVAGAHSGKVRFRPAGAPGVSRSLLVFPDDPKVMAGTRHAVTEIGIGPLLDRLGKIATIEKALSNPVEVYTSDFQFDGRNVTRYEILTRRPHTHRYAYRCLVFVDKEMKLPVRFEAYDAPKPGTTAGELIEAHSFTNLRLNAGLGDSAFE